MSENTAQRKKDIGKKRQKLQEKLSPENEAEKGLLIGKVL